MTSAGEIFVDLRGRDVNLAALLAQLDARMRQTDQTGLKLGGTLAGPLSASEQRAANAAIQEAQAMARAAVAVGDNARAHEILVGALGNSAGASDRAVAGLTTQIANLQSGKTIATQFGEGLKSSLLSIIGPAALAGAAFGALRSVVSETEEAFKLKASLDQSQASIRVLLAGVRDSGEVFASASRFANQYKLTQQETTEAIQASIRIIRSSKAPVEDILGAFARLKVLAPEKTFQDASRALSELQAGQVVSIEHLFNVPRADANAMKKEIEGGADAVKVLNDYLDRTGITMDAVKTQTEGAAGKMRELAQASENLQLALGQSATGPGLAILNERILLTQGLTNVLRGQVVVTRESATAFDGLYKSIGAALSFDFGSAISAAQQQAQAARDAAAAAQTQAAINAAVAVSARDDAVAVTQQSLATQQLAIAQSDTRRESILIAQAAQEAAIASQTDAQQKQLQALMTQAAGVEAQNAANAFLALNPNINASGIQSAVTAGAITPLIGRLAELTLQVLQAKAALAGANLEAARVAVGRTRISGNETADDVASGKHARATAALTARQKAAGAAAAAEANYQKTLGNYGVAIAQAEAQLSHLTKGTAAYYDKQNEIAQLKEAQARAARKKHGAVKLSDQQKLDNSLISDQERYHDQAEQAAIEHGRRLIEIERDYQKKSLEQQKKNELSKRESELGFLKSITDSELNATKEGRAEIARINAQFYADFEEAQKAAQAGNAEQSERLVEQARHRAEVEQEYAEKIAEARKNKDQDEIARLTALLEKERQLLDEQKKQIVEGGDANVNAKNEALTEEDRRYAEQQEKNATAAESAGERKINAAERSGKAIDAENTKLREQEAIFNRIGGRQAGPGAAGGGTSTPALPTATETSAAAAGAPPDAVSLGAVKDAIVGALASLEKTTASGADKVARAVSARAVQA